MCVALAVVALAVVVVVVVAVVVVGKPWPGCPPHPRLPWAYRPCFHGSVTPRSYTAGPSSRLQVGAGCWCGQAGLALGRPVCMPCPCCPRLPTAHGPPTKPPSPAPPPAPVALPSPPPPPSLPCASPSGGSVCRPHTVSNCLPPSHTTHTSFRPPKPQPEHLDVDCPGPPWSHLRTA